MALGIRRASGIDSTNHFFSFDSHFFCSHFFFLHEIDMLLIKEDQSVPFDDTGKMLQETSPLGVLLYPESKEADYQKLIYEEQ